MSKRPPKTSYWQDAPLPREQLVLIPESLEARIPEDHPVRLLDEILSQVDWSVWEGEYDGRAGQPPIHPGVLCKVLLFALIRRVRSSRQMEYHLKHSIDFMWLASGRTIDHTTLSEFRRQHPQQLRELYRQVVQVAVRLGVAKLAEVCIDGTRVLANANRSKTLKAEKVEQLLAELDRQIAAAMQELEANDGLEDLFADGLGADRLTTELQEMKSRQEQLRRALSQLREMERQRKHDGIDPRKNPAQLPATDGDSRILPNKEGGYAANYTPMAAADVERLPVNAQTKCFDKQAFVYDEPSDSFYCPAGKRLTREGVEQRQRGGTAVEQTNYRGQDCAGCPLGARCRKNPDARVGRKVTRDGYEAVRRRHGERMRQDEAKARYRRRQHYGETPFAVLKAVLDLRRFLLRGIEGVKQEWLWACTAFNIKKLAGLWAALRAKRAATAITQNA
jgi:transposase